jgi:hypothetical protein
MRDRKQYQILRWSDSERDAPWDEEKECYLHPPPLKVEAADVLQATMVAVLRHNVELHDIASVIID